MRGALEDVDAHQNTPRTEGHRPSYKGRQPASKRASAAARGSSKKTDTRCELLLRRTLWAAGARYRKNVKELPGRPDVVFSRAKLVVFCDGDFWHGRNWDSRRQKLVQGTNPDYWISKIERNIERDRLNTSKLEEMGWIVLRLWETEIRSNPMQAADRVLEALKTLDKTGLPSVNRAQEPGTPLLISGKDA
jgi:DNA mismatch endonuclease, patch repair protein